jgi:uncharacterized protein YndB with AHSA1/START domain
MSALNKEAFYPYPVEAVWAALTNGEAVAQWLMPNNIQSPPRVGDRFEFRVDPLPFIGGLVECEVLEVDPPRRLVWSWIGAKEGGRKRPPQRVEWELVPREDGTLLRLRQSDVDKLPWIMRTMMAFGWGTMLKRWLPKIIANFQLNGGSWTYRRLAKPPNRGHHGVKTIPPTFYK